jgi:two-component system nitrate/nitrite response regulator NarL
MESPIRVFLVDDHRLFRLGIRSALVSEPGRFEIVGEAGTAAEFFRTVSAARPDIVLLDILLPDMNGEGVAAKLRRELPDIKILVLSADVNENRIAKLLSTGIEGFISKNTAVDDLKKAIELIMEGGNYFGRDVSSLIRYVRVSRMNVPSTVFTDRESEVIELCSKGLSAKEISERMDVNVATVNTFKNNIFKKLGINSSVELVLYALKHGIITL